MKISIVNWKKEDLGYDEHQDKIKDTVIIHDNGCVLAIEKQTSKLFMIDALSKQEVLKYFDESIYDVLNLNNYEINLIDHPEYYFLEKSWLLKICNFLDKSTAFSTLSFNGFVRFSPNDPKLSRQIAQRVINDELFNRGYATRYGSYCYVSEEGKMFARQTKGSITADTTQKVQDFIAAAPTFLEGRMHEYGKYRDQSIKDIYKDQASKKWMSDATPKMFATEFAKMIFLKIVPTSKVPSIIKLLKISDKTFNDILTSVSKQFTHTIESEEKDRKEKTTINRMNKKSNVNDHLNLQAKLTDKNQSKSKSNVFTPTANTTNSKNATNSKDDITDDEDEHEDTVYDATNDKDESEDISDSKFLYERYDENIDIITDPIYIKQQKVSIVRNHFNGTNELFWDKDHINQLHKMFLVKNKFLQLHMPNDTCNLLAVLLYHEKLDRKQVYNYLKTRKDYPNQICMRDIIQRFLEIALMK